MTNEENESNATPQTDLEQALMIGTRSKLIDRLGQEYKALYEKYPEGHSNAWRPLALGIAIAALAEEEYQKDWRDICRQNRARK